MLTDTLSFKQRKTGSVANAPDHEAMRKTIDLLHRDDKGVLRYFGVDRQALLNGSAFLSLMECEGDDCLQTRYEQNIGVLASLPFEAKVSDCDDFGVFCARWYNYLKHVFESDLKYTGGVRNFVFGHNMSKRCMYANQKETRVARVTENPERAARAIHRWTDDR